MTAMQTGIGGAWPLHQRGENRLLQLLPAAERARLMRSLERVKTTHGDVVFDRNQRIKTVDFRLIGVISVVVVMEQGGIADVGTVGNEGMAGVPLVLGATSTPNTA